MGRVGMRRVVVAGTFAGGDGGGPVLQSGSTETTMPSPSPAVVRTRVRQPSPSPAQCARLDSRMQKAIVLSHEDAALPCTVPYLAARLRPLPVMEVLGRSAKREPKCKPLEAVYYFWKECPCPGSPYSIVFP